MRIAIVMLCCGLTSAGVATENSNEAAANESASRVAVVELFTSQGCSSCPPADAVLKQLSTQPNQGGDVFALSFHVDYWNRLGWTDPYSNAYASRRQRAYASGFRSNRVYTPQMVVNGKYEFVGSHAIKAKAAIQKAHEEPARCVVELKASTTKTDVTVEYRVRGNSGEDVLNLALVQNAQPIAIERGENSGRRLGHANVVRNFIVIPPAESSSGSTSMKLPNDFRSEDASIIGYLQNAKTFEITGAEQVRFDIVD